MTFDETLPMFASNRPDKNETVAGEINKLFEIMRTKLRETPNIAIATAFINPAGFTLIADEVFNLRVAFALIFNVPLLAILPPLIKIVPFTFAVALAGRIS